MPCCAVDDINQTCRQMPKREAEKLASEIWAFKDEQDAAAVGQSSAGSPMTLADATGVFLERRFFAIPRLVTEVSVVSTVGQA